MARRNIGLERALEHIRQHEQLARELGGTLEDVERFFFSLSPELLESVLDLYEARYGGTARTYAADTYLDWKSGKRKLSGQTASRLFNILPRIMTAEDRFGLIRSLWQKLGPETRAEFVITTETTREQICARVRVHFNDEANTQSIPEGVRRRFDWLYDNDAAALQELLCQIRAQERRFIVDRVGQAFDALKPTIDDPNTKGGSHEISLGKHTVVLYFGDKARVAAGVDGGGAGWLTLPAILLVIAIFVGTRPKEPEPGSLQDALSRVNRSTPSDTTYRFSDTSPPTRQPRVRKTEAAPRPKTITGKVVGVADGDTLTVLDEGIERRVRLLGIDSPESTQAFGDKATFGLSDKVLGKSVRIVYSETDRYSRLLGDVYLGERWINKEMVQAGWAWHFKQYSSDARLAQAEEAARVMGLGLWQHETPVPPWDFR